MSPPVAGVEADPVDPVGLSVGDHRIAIAPGFHSAETADLRTLHTRHFGQGEGFAERLAEVDAALVGNHGAGNVQVLRVVAAPRYSPG